MDEFLDINQDWFAKKYLPLLGRRFWTFKIALNLFVQLSGKNIVETGCLRQKDDWEAGMSTLILADFVAHQGGVFDSIDISQKNIELAKEVLFNLEKYVNFHKGDSLAVLKSWQTPIDFLFLDSLDTDPNNEEIALKAQKHQLDELKLAWPNLTKNAIVLLDDNYFVNGGKTRLAKAFLEKKGCLNIMDYEASLWVRRG